MSVIVIRNHDENIKKILEKYTITSHQFGEVSEVETKKPKRILKKLQCVKEHAKEHATMGYPVETLPDPCDFLKKHTGKLSYSEDEAKGNIQKHKCHRKEKLFPTKEDIELYNDRKKKDANKHVNYIVKNVKKVLQMKMKEPEPQVVLEPHGDKKRLSQGLEPIYTKTHVFGKTPKYLKMIIKKQEKLHQMQKDAVNVEKPKCQYIRRDERKQLLAGLKHNWESLQNQYQGLPILTDTIPKKLRKSKLEAELKQLEKDIVLVERHPYIYIYDDNVVFQK